MDTMGDESICTRNPRYHSPHRTALETILCLLIAASYIPQYVAIARNGTAGISSRYVLYHGLFSTLTLSFHLAHQHYYEHFNGVRGGASRGWKAYSSLLGYIQSVVQFVASVTFLALYLHYRTPTQPDDLPPAPELALSAMLGVTIGIAVTTLSISFAFLWFNQAGPFTDDSPGYLSNYILVYVFGQGAWLMVLLLANVAVLVLQFVYAVQTVRARGAHGALSAVALLMQAVVFVWLGCAQAVRSGSWPLVEDLDHPIPEFGRFMEVFLAFYGTVHVYVMYVACGLGCLGLFIVCMMNGGFGERGALRI